MVEWKRVKSVITLPVGSFCMLVNVWVVVFWFIMAVLDRYENIGQCHFVVNLSKNIEFLHFFLTM